MFVIRNVISWRKNMEMQLFPCASFAILIVKDARFCAPGVKKPLGNRRRLL